MIKSEKGKVTVEGNLFDVIFEFHHLIRAMVEEDPELISAVIFKNGDALHDIIEKCDSDKLRIIENHIDYIEHVREDNNDEY